MAMLRLIALARVSFYLRWTLVCWALPPSLQAQPVEPNQSAVVELPEFTVVDTKVLPPPEAWRYARIEGFEILSNVSDSIAVKLVRDFQRFHQALNVAWPPARIRTGAPTAIILCGKGEMFSRFILKKRGTSSFRSLSMRDRELSAIVLDLETIALNSTSPETMRAMIAVGTAPPGSDEIPLGITSGLPEYLVDHYKNLYREYVRYVLAQLETPPPPWLEEGLAQIFMQMRFSPTIIEVGRLEQGSEARPSVGWQGSADRPPLARQARLPTTAQEDFNIALAKRRLLPMEELFGERRGYTWSKQCYAFVHYGLYASGGKHRKAFFDLVSRTTHEPMTEQVFKECFGHSYKDFVSELRGYIEFTSYKTIQFRAPKGKRLETPVGPEFRDATQPEIGRIKGETFRLAGQYEAARAALLSPYLRSETDPELLAALGLYESAHGEPARARQLLEVATAAGVVRPRAYVELARFYHRDALLQPAGAEGLFSPGQVATVLQPLFAARAQIPALQETYDLIADTWTRSAVPPTAENLQVLDEGVRRFPRHVTLVYEAARLKALLGFNADASALIKLGRKVTNDATMLEKFSALDARLSARRSNP